MIRPIRDSFRSQILRFDAIQTFQYPSILASFSISTGMSCLMLEEREVLCINTFLPVKDSDKKNFTVSKGRYAIY